LIESLVDQWPFSPALAKKVVPYPLLTLENIVLDCDVLQPNNNAADNNNNSKKKS